MLRRVVSRSIPVVVLVTAVLRVASGADLVSPPDDRIAAATRSAVARWLEAYHRDAAQVDVPALVEEARRRVRSGHSTDDLNKWLNDALWRSDHFFAKRNAVHDDSVRYRLPFDPKIPRGVSQGVDGPKTHFGAQRFAWDFLMPIGTPVHAAREGVVAQVVDGFPDGGIGAEHRGRGNSVRVLHADGTFATYYHLRSGIPVRRGQTVKPRQLLAYSGDSGRSDGPHLHFMVNRLDASGEFESLPIRFGGKKGYVPQERQYYGKPPRPNQLLRLSLDGHPLRPGETARIRYGDSVQLKVEVRRPQGRFEDVTRHAATEYASMTLWSMDVTPEGRAIARPAHRFGGTEMQRDAGAVSVFYVNSETREVGLGKIEFEILDAPAYDPAEAERQIRETRQGS